ncbi:hypothetical protein HD554DRAFT_2073506 [Boletus coccyginus]|nr:hypothetical protein HD554DRAFT_2073506 [Boletus coccyginus]
MPAATRLPLKVHGSKSAWRPVQVNEVPHRRTAFAFDPPEDALAAFSHRGNLLSSHTTENKGTCILVTSKCTTEDDAMAWIIKLTRSGQAFSNVSTRLTLAFPLLIFNSGYA